MGKKQKFNKKERIEEIGKELKANEEILAKNKNQYKLQVQMGLIRKGFPPNMMYDSLLEKLGIEIEEMNIKLDSKFEVVHPMFRFQSEPRWRAIQIEVTEKQLKQHRDNIEEIQKRVVEVKKEVAAQTIRIEARNKDIKEELKKLNS